MVIEGYKTQFHPAVTENDRRLSSMFNALSDLNRFRVFKLLTRRQDLCVSDLARVLGVSVPAVSQQLRILEMNGLVERERRGQMICYKIKKDDPVVKFVIKITSSIK